MPFIRKGPSDNHTAWELIECKKSRVGAWCELSSAWKFGVHCHGLFPARRGSGDNSEGAGALPAPGPTREGAPFSRGGPRGLEVRLQMPVRLVSWWADIWAQHRGTWETTARKQTPRLQPGPPPHLPEKEGRRGEGSYGSYTCRSHPSQIFSCR